MRATVHIPQPRGLTATGPGGVPIVTRSGVGYPGASMVCLAFHNGARGRRTARQTARLIPGAVLATENRVRVRLDVLQAWYQEHGTRASDGNWSGIARAIASARWEHVTHTV